ncbi:MAG TPA: hypothetical protein D7I06_05295 [Candidatus Poseidoniales archaeon]|nr:MAG TPA: hypothetical protein D7I06_05295 [Candidatus Poseidoniales archaeon]HII63002.1 hypothetical protein [Candidatus Poseidoniaceae archaeon]|tara:strand:+ start:2807 stop:4795 length:1989 start_codon:yes stop_codon:yes gene_type:complete
MSEVDAIVVLTVGRSRATTHFHLKWAKTLGERVLVLASCRNESGVAMIQEATAINKERVELLTYTGQSDTVTDQISQEVIERTSANSELQTMVVFAGGDKSVYCNVYSNLSQGDFKERIHLITETEIHETTTYTIEDWVNAVDSSKFHYESEENKLTINSRLGQIKLSHLQIGNLNNPTRLTCDFEYKFSFDYTKINKFKQHFKRSRIDLIKKIRTLNLILIDQNLTTDIRIKLTPIVETNFECMRIYLDKNYLARSMFYSLTTPENFVIEFDGLRSDNYSKRILEVCKSFWITQGVNKHATAIAEEIENSLSEVRKINLTGFDGMKWLLNQNDVQISNSGGTVVMVDSGYNGRELAELVREHQGRKIHFKVFNSHVETAKENNFWLSSLLISQNINHYLHLKEFKPFRSDLQTVIPYPEGFDDVNSLSIHKMYPTKKGKRKQFTIDFSLDDKNKIHTMIKDDFAEFLFAITVGNQSYETYNESGFRIEGDELIMKDKELYKVHRITLTENRLTPDGYRLVKNENEFFFEIWDMVSPANFSPNITEKYLKYEKSSSKFPVRIRIGVFAMLAGEHGQNSSQDFEALSEIMDVLSYNKDRKLKLLDLNALLKDISDSQPVKICLNDFREFLIDDGEMYNRNLMFFKEWMGMKTNSDTTTSTEEE